MNEDLIRGRSKPGTADGNLARLTQALPAGLRAELESIWREHLHAPGVILLREDQDAGTIGFVVKGLLGMVKQLPDGRRHIVGLLAPGDIYGRAFDGTSGYRIEALTETVVLTCARARFEHIIGRSPEAEHLLLANLLDELDAAREWVIVLGGPRTVQRLASFLVILCRRKRWSANPGEWTGTSIRLRLQIKRRDLAQYLGARPESLSRAFRELEKAGLIRINDPYDFDVLSLPGLVDAAGQDLALDEDF